MSNLLISYDTGTIGYNLPNDLDAACVETVRRCNELKIGATIIDREKYTVMARVFATNNGYEAKKGSL